MTTKPFAYVALSITVAALMLLALGREPVAEQSTAAESAMSRSVKHQRSSLTPDSQSAAMNQQSSDFAKEVAFKYEVLLEGVAPYTRDRLQEILVAREATRDSDVDEATHWERHLSILLREDEYALYEQLRESESEQAQLQAFARQLHGASPLTIQQQQELLRAKLRYKHKAQALEFQAATPRPDLTTMEDGYARDIAVQGIDHFVRAFLDDVRPVLADEQWLALERFEMAALEQRMRQSEAASLQRNIERSGPEQRESTL